MKCKSNAFALVDLLVTAAVTVVLLSISVPALSRARELSKRSVCGVNLAGIGAAAKVYAAANKEKWMTPPFDRTAIDEEGIDYVNDQPTNYDPGDVGDLNERRTPTRWDTPPTQFGSTSCSVTRAYWMLVRSGDVSVKQFICPSSLDDSTDPTVEIEIDRYYDFTDYRNISYGYQVPFGPQLTQPREGADNRRIFAADKGPFYVDVSPKWNTAGENGGPIDLDDPPRQWWPFNSPNHGGPGNGDGQNALYADGHVAFVRIPACGIDGDNIYTVMSNEWQNTIKANLIHGDTVFQSGAKNPYPGQDALGFGPGRYSSTDSLIYP